MKHLLTTTLLLAFAAQPATNDLDLDFRGSQFRETVLGYVGPNAKKYIKAEQEGLRITIPGAEKSLPQMGISSKLAVHGDFEITLSYEMIGSEKPTSGYGAGLNLTIFADTPEKDSATIARRTHPKQGEVYATNRAFKTPNGEDKNNTAMFPTTATKGKLRFVRGGSVLVFSAAEPSNETFNELRRVEFVDQPLKLVRVTGDTGKSASGVDFRILSLQIHSRELSPSTTASTLSGSWTWVIIFALAIPIVVLASYFGWRFYRKRLDAD